MICYSAIWHSVDIVDNTLTVPEDAQAEGVVHAQGRADEVLAALALCILHITTIQYT